MNQTNPAHARLIALCGQAGSGKDTAAEMLYDALVYNKGLAAVRRYAFADPIRDMITVLMGYTGYSGATGLQWMQDRVLKEQPIDGIGHSYRKLAQTLGTEWGRAVDPDLWVKLTQARIQKLRFTTDHPVTVIITDLRFPNEAKMVKDMGGVIWRITGRSAGISTQHASEQLVDQIECDAEIDNTGTLTQLQEKLSERLHREWQLLKTV